MEKNKFSSGVKSLESKRPFEKSEREEDVRHDSLDKRPKRAERPERRKYPEQSVEGRVNENKGQEAKSNVSTYKSNIDIQNSKQGGCSKEREKIRTLLDFDLESSHAAQIFELVRSVANGEVSPVLAADCLRTKYVSVSARSTLVFRILDCVSFMLDEVKFKQNIEIFLESLENFGVTTSREIVTAIDAQKLDSCGYSTGLTVLSIRERTRSQYVLKVYSLWRECVVGYDLLHQLLYFCGFGFGQDCADNYVVDSVRRMKSEVKRLSGEYFLCPNRVLYELVLWCCDTKFEYSSPLEFASVVAEILEDFPNESLEQVFTLLLSQQHQARVKFLREGNFWKETDILGWAFYDVCAILLTSRRLSLEKLYGFLYPKDSELKSMFAHFSLVAQQSPINFDRWNIPAAHLKAIANCIPNDQNYLSETLESVTSLLKFKRPSLVHLDPSSINAARKLLAARNSQSAGPSEEPKDCDFIFLPSDGYGYVRDQIYAVDCDKFRLLGSLLDCVASDLRGPAWELCEILIRHLRKNANFPVALNGFVSKPLCRLILRIVRNYLNPLSGDGSPDYSPSNLKQQEKSPEESPHNEGRLKKALKELSFLLSILGPRLYVDAVAFSEVLKLLGLAITIEVENVCKFMWKFILPALCLLSEGNCQLGDRLWDVLSKLQVSNRYRIYHKFCRSISSSSSDLEVRASHNSALAKTRSIFKRVTSNMLKSTKNATVRGTVSLVTGIASTNPFAVADTIISQCEMFENLVGPLSEVGKYFTRLPCDVFFFKLCCNERLMTISRKKAELVDELGKSRKLVVNAQLAARFFKRHVDVSLYPLLLAVLLSVSSDSNMNILRVVNLQDEEELTKIKVRPWGRYPDELGGGWLSLEYVFKLLEVAGGVPQLAEAHALTQDQLYAQGGGVLLRMEIMARDPDDELCSVTSREGLAKVILCPLFLNSLILLCGKMKSEILYDSDFSGRIRLMCAIVDSLQRAALQLVDFARTAKTLGNNKSCQFVEPDISKLSLFWSFSDSLSLSNFNLYPDQNIKKGHNLECEMINEEFCDFVCRLKLQDIWVPTEQYNKSLQRLGGWISEISAHSGNGYRRLKRLKLRHQALEREFISQKERVFKIRNEFEHVCREWLQKDIPQIGPAVTSAFVKHCIFSRLFSSEVDALFCGKLVDLMLELRVEYFNFFDFSNCWTKMLMPMVSCCTEREAPLLAIFVSHTFSSIKRWSLEPAEFEALAKGHPCFCTTFKFLPEKALTHQQLLCGIRKWEGRILRALSFALGLQLCENPQTRPTWIDQKGAIVFLARCHESFPVTAPAGKRVLGSLSKVVENAQYNGWKDIVVAANTLLKTFEKYDKECRWL